MEPNYTTAFSDPDYTTRYLQAFPETTEIEVERYSNIISKSGERLSEHEFFFEWFTEPSME